MHSKFSIGGTENKGGNFPKSKSSPSDRQPAVIGHQTRDKHLRSGDAKPRPHSGSDRATNNPSQSTWRFSGTEGRGVI